ncbi:polyprenyl synthetase family protein [Nocardia sp. NPDC052566]|uniref:polyprenyl synthetase family protein n=1 Tax=Nocardia sp. NPDC052566 TaxID=3364330 RepID=UPI0037C73266
MTSGQLAPGAATIEPLIRDLAAGWPADLSRLHEMARYAVLPAGKLIRPLLMLEAGRAVGADPLELAPVAIALEYLHVATLVHDDIIDGDLLRRGRPTVHAKYGQADAIVVGDALLLDTFGTLATAGGRSFPAGAVLETVRIVAAAGIDLCRGQTAEAELAGDIDCGVSRYRSMAALKTGALFKAACAAGGVLGGGSTAQVDALRTYAEHVGCAFQMRDDLLPYLRDTTRSGKSPVSDIANRRPTFPVLVGLELADAAQRRRIERSLSGRLAVDASYRLLHEVLTETGALAAAAARVAAEANAARDSVLIFGERGATLAAIAAETIERTW